MRVLLAALLLAAPALALAPSVASHPPQWWETTMLDADHDHVDDALAPSLRATDALTVLVDYASMPTPADAAAVEAHGFAVTFAPHHFPLLVARGPGTAVRGLLDLPGVVFVEHDDTLYPLLKDSVPLIGATTVWQQYGVTGKGIVVAVLDDGAFEQHPDLQPKLVGDFDASTASLSPVPFQPPVDTVTPAAGSGGHGTHVAGIVVGGGEQSGGLYKGVAPDARFVNVKVFSAADQTSSDIVLRGIDWTLDNVKTMHIRVASMSLGGSQTDGTDAISRAVNIAVSKGLVVVAAAGNAGPGPKTITTPGAAADAITVGAVDKRKNLADFSSRGPTLDGRLKPDLVAPGVDITSTIPPTQTSATGLLTMRATALYYGALSGTSMAAPHVAGVVALMLQANPDLTPYQVKQILIATAQDLGTPGTDNATGYGFVNAIAAVQVAKDPSLLDSPELRARLATLPPPQQETMLDKLSFEAEAMVRDGKAPYVVGAVVLGALVLVGLAVIVARRVRKP
jgi:serine protease AprX